jgi:hypothetical protein
MHVNRSRWSRVVATIAVVAVLGSCSSDDPESPTDSLTPDPEDVGMPADAESVETPEGERVYVSESTASVYGACSVLEPHEDDVAGWLGIDPPRGYSDYGVVCT